MHICNVTTGSKYFALRMLFALTMFILLAPMAQAEKLTETSKQPSAMTAEQMDKANPYIQQGIVKGYAQPWQLGFQKPATPVFEKLIGIHDYLLVVITVITVFVMILIAYVCYRFSEKRNPVPSRVTHNTLIEVLWTTIPILILVSIAIPSLRTHFFMTKIEPHPELTLKVTGYQWYWGYEYLDAKGTSLASYESRMIPQDQVKPEKGQIRLLSVDNPVVVPVGTLVEVLETGNDVIHSWSVPAFGVKTDAVPGRMNQTWFQADKEGIYYGQCSELCGVYHGFMPIEIHVVSKDVFTQWAANAKTGHYAMDGLRVPAIPAATSDAAPAPALPAVKPQALNTAPKATTVAANTPKQ